MRAKSVLEVVPKPTLPGDYFSMTAGKFFTRNGTLQSGFNSGVFQTPFGSIGGDGTLAPWGYPGQVVYACQLVTDYPANYEGTSTLTFWTVSDDTSEIDPQDVGFMEFWLPDQVIPGGTGATFPQTRALQSFIYKSSEAVVAGQYIAVYEGTIPGPIFFLENAEYYCYNYDVISGQDPIPEVRWEEDSAPNENTQINHRTMPHCLELHDDGTFDFGTFNDFSYETAGALVRRVSGSNETNPFPDFVNRKLTDIATFQGRLALLANDQVSMSVTNQVSNWFRGTVTQLLSTSLSR
jgi:hypothetical protein